MILSRNVHFFKKMFQIKTLCSSLYSTYFEVIGPSQLAILCFVIFMSISLILFIYLLYSIYRAPQYTHWAMCNKVRKNTPKKIMIIHAYQVECLQLVNFGQKQRRIFFKKGFHRSHWGKGAAGTISWRIVGYEKAGLLLDTCWKFSLVLPN